jgi:hypothetical protein
MSGSKDPADRVSDQSDHSPQRHTDDRSCEEPHKGHPWSLVLVDEVFDFDRRHGPSLVVSGKITIPWWMRQVVA